jgi:spoIIIJ-associated protein
MTENRTFIEIIALNVEEAVARGLAELGVEEEHVDVEVLDKGNPDEGRQARVRLTVVDDEDQPEDNTVSVARSTLQELLAQMHVRARVAARWAEAVDDEERPLVLNVQGDDLGMLIGHKGETLSALQYLARVLIAKRMTRALNVVVDVENYKIRREEQLRRLARRIADQAVQQGRTVSLEPMPPNERRIIHLTLRDRTDVTTESVGDGRARKVTVIPRNKKGQS